MKSKQQIAQKVLDELCAHTNEIDTLGINEIFVDIVVANMEVVLKFKRSVIPKIQSVMTAFNAVKQDLDAVKAELVEKEEELKKKNKCFICPTIEKKLTAVKKKQAINESRIKSIANILAHHVPDTQDVNGTDNSEIDSDERTLTKAYNLVSQVLGCEPLSRTEGENRLSKRTKSEKRAFKNKCLDKCSSVVAPFNPKNQISTARRTSDEKENSVDDILMCSLEENDEEHINMYHSPTKITEGGKSHSSPVFGNVKKTVRGEGLATDADSCQTDLCRGETENCNLENSFYIPPSPSYIRNSRNSVFQSSIKTADSKGTESLDLQKNSILFKSEKKTADFWKLKTSVDDQSSIYSMKGCAKLKQSKLSLGYCKRKIDLCGLEEFNGGIRKTQTSTQKSEIGYLKLPEASFKVNVISKDDDFVVDCPEGNILDSKLKGERFFNSGRKLSCNSGGCKIAESNKIRSFDQLSDKKSTSKSEETLEGIKGLADNFDCMTKAISSPKYKYRGSTVRKKSERQQLLGWNCENCKKYYEAAGGSETTEEELQKLMNQCSRHRDKNPVRPKTPPGFWDADFPHTPDCEALNRTFMDILPQSKKHKTT